MRSEKEIRDELEFMRQDDVETWEDEIAMLEWVLDEK
jgi:hypothetical protein